MPHRSDLKRQDSEEVFTADMIPQQTVKAIHVVVSMIKPVNITTMYFLVLYSL